MADTASPTVRHVEPALLPWFVDGVEAALRDRGTSVARSDAADGFGANGVVLYPVDLRRPRGFRRRSRAVFVIGLGEAETAPVDPLRMGYPLLLRTLANIFVLVTVGDGPGPVARFFTLEQGSYSVRHAGDDGAFFAAVAGRLAPLASSHLVLENDFVRDLPPDLWAGDAHTRAIGRAGARLDALDLLPAPFPLHDFLSPDDFRHVQSLFSIGGLSYGNLSERRDPTSFWMSASGVDKSRLREVGRDVLLVTGYDAKRRAIRVSVPPHVEPRRVSVDAIEHHVIYREHPAAGAILHVHAWMEGVRQTEINFPCGTEELAEEVAALVRASADPSRAVIGLRNHGLTITGHSLAEIFDRIDGKILRQVPMS